MVQLVTRRNNSTVQVGSRMFQLLVAPTDLVLYEDLMPGFNDEETSACHFFLGVAAPSSVQAHPSWKRFLESEDGKLAT